MENKGLLLFGSDNYMSFGIENEKEYFLLNWEQDPEAFAENLKKAAKWIEKHKNKKIYVDID